MSMTPKQQTGWIKQELAKHTAAQSITNRIVDAKRMLDWSIASGFDPAPYPRFIKELETKLVTLETLC